MVSGFNARSRVCGFGCADSGVQSTPESAHPNSTPELKLETARTIRRIYRFVCPQRLNVKDLKSKVMSQSKLDREIKRVLFKRAGNEKNL